MKEYAVSVPICGYAVKFVEAEDEDEAIAKAIDTVELSDIESWEALEHITKGNCFNGPMNDVEVEET
jgi:hypothetical protein